MNTVPAAHDPKLGFAIHALVFTLAIGSQIALNLWLGGYFWAIWPALGWTIGLLAHGWVVAAGGCKAAAH